MKIGSIFNPQNYINKINSFKKSLVIIELIKREFPSITLNNIWELDEINYNEELHADISKYKIFGTSINLNNINWHKDYVSGFEYPVKRFDKIKISKWFDKGIDVKFPWEVSRFYFAIRLAQNYVITKDSRHYHKFRELVLDWMEKNPFCFGVNWVCTMEVAIRAINWIAAINIFGKVFEKDAEFNEVFSKSLIQHAEYISAFPEIYEFNNKMHTSNHTTADYTGLLFLALILEDHPESEKWLKQSIEGLEECIRYQTYEDGVNFEASIPYHRLVLEMFAYAVIAAKENGVEFSRNYYELLFKMFEYSAAYMDHSGNAPQVGDNDSGRILIFHESDEHDHSYLLDLGEHIFDCKFRSQCKKRNSEFKQWLPKVEKINVDKLNVILRETDKSSSFEHGGAYFLKNEYFSLMVACFPIGQNGFGGHNHYDMGSFTLSYKGQPIVVDPGTYNYSRRRGDRDKYRHYNCHNIIVGEMEKRLDIRKNKIWSLKKTNNLIVKYFNNDSISIKINSIYNNELSKEREFKILDNYVQITDNYKGFFYSLIHLHPDIDVISINKNEINTNVFKISKEGNEENTVTDYNYSNKYDGYVNAILLKIKSTNINKLKLDFRR